MKAIWNGAVLAESDETVVVDGNHYFPRGSINAEYFTESRNRTVCHWKGTANYFHVSVDGSNNPDAAWTYAQPLPEARHLADHVAFWRGVEVVAS
ncbi:DUF427 domain-containing protein [Agromyces sp. SYSU T00194]|uniref:DUF427 domain-containing protein n=1 Tax=Agromyces chitinivorans TaxID=3158560 RepID=UPI00339AB5F7